MEVFSGTGRLSLACRQAGLRSLPIDKDPKGAENVLSANFDLTDPQQFESLLELVRAEKGALIHAHFAPCCGTASKARNIKIPNVRLSMQPRPLRSNEDPDGIPNLPQKDQDRLLKENESYKATKNLVIELLQMGVSVSIENAANSLFCETSWIRLLLEKFVGHQTQFHHCMHGGDRDQLTTLWSFNPRAPGLNLMESLSLLCDKQHGHKSWRPKSIDGKLTFFTKEEAAYPQLLCNRMASIFVEKGMARSFVFPSDLQQQVQQDPNIGKGHLFAAQTRTQKIKQPVSEFGKTIVVAVPLNATTDEESFGKFPKGFSIVTRHIQSGFFGDVFCKNHEHPMVHNDLRLKDLRSYITAELPIVAQKQIQ